MEELNVPTRALDYAEETGLSQMAEQGYGRDYMNNFMKSAYANAQSKFKTDAASVGAGMMRNGMENSGVADKAMSSVAASFMSSVTGAETQAWENNEGARRNAAGQMMSLYQSQDQMEFSKEQSDREQELRESAQGGFWNKALRAATFVGGMASGYGSASTLFNEVTS